MKAFFLLVLSFFIITFSSQAQSSLQSTGRVNQDVLRQRYSPPCPSDLLLHRLMAGDSSIRNRHENLDQFIYDQLNIAGNNQQRIHNPQNHPRTLYSIPVVVHIIHNNGAENISDAQVALAIQDLNEAYSNSGVFAQINGVDVGIQFCLATQDPNGAFTTGITRDVSTLTELTMETDDITLKNINRWDPLRYVNIWVVRDISSLSMGSGVAGYAYFPSSHGNPEDGIVNEAAYFGNSHDNSKVLIHEAGHYLGLYHTFEGGCTNNNCLTDGDHVCDTPPDNSTASTACNAAPNTCTSDDADASVNNPFRPVSAGGLGDQPDQIENYMDYGFLTCHTLFTSGQADRMSTALSSSRASLLASHGCWSLCTSPIVAAFDTSVSNVSIGATLNLSNFSTGATSYEWFLNGISVSTSQDLSYVFSSPGTYIITMIASNGDSSCTKSAADTIRVDCSTVSTFTYSTSNCIPKNTAVLFTNTTSGSVTCQWLLDGQVIGTGNTIPYNFYQSGGFQVSLVSYNGSCYDTSASEYIQVGRCQDLEAANWYFGNYAGLDFTSGSPVAVTNSAMFDFEGSVSMSDKSGNLQFYTYGDSVFNMNHVAMPNSIYMYGGFSASQSGLAVAWPNRPNKYIYFQTAVFEDTFAAPFRYSVIDMNMNGGSGDIYPYNVFLHSPVVEKITGTMHCNGKQIWILTHEWNSNRFLAYLVDSNGVNTTPVISAVGQNIAGNYQTPGQGQMKFSSDGKWLAVTTFSLSFEIFHFDNATGIVSNPITIPASYYNYGVEFSPDNTKVYTFEHSGSADGHIIQFDLSSGNPTTIANSWTEVLLIAPGNQNSLQLAPNGKIYFSNGFSPFDAYVGVINYPNATGVACQAAANGVYLNGKSSILGLPNFMSTAFYTDDLLINGPDTICPNATAVQYSIHANVWNLGTYNWSLLGNSTITSYTDSTVNIDFSSGGIDTLVILKSTNCGMLSDTMFIHVIPQLPDLGPDTSVCSGDTLILSLPDAYFSYSWQDGSSSPTFSALQPGDYWVDVLSANGCLLRDSISITLDTSTTQVDLGPDKTICTGAVVVLDAGSGYDTYRWQDGSPNSQFTAWQSGTYWVQVSKRGDCNAFAVDTIHVLFDNTLQISLGTDTTLCDGGSLLLSPGNGFATYLWSDQSTASSLTVTASGDYTVQVVSALNCIASDTIQVIIDTLHADLGPDLSVCSGGLLVLTPGLSFASYAWSDQSTASTLSVTQSGDYSVRVSTSNNCISSDTIHIDNYTVPPVYLGPDTSLCPGESLTLTATPGFSSYHWSTNETGNSITVTQDGDYAVTATTAQNCNAIDSIHVRYYVVQAIDAGPDTTICENEVITLHASNNFYVYNWSTGSHDSTTQVSQAGIYWVTASADISCLSADTVEVFTKECKGPQYYIHIFPNPFDDNFSLEIFQGRNINDLQIDLYDELGQWVYHGSMDTQKDLIIKKDIAVNLAAGIYLLYLKGDDVNERVKLLRY
ncbi:MAG: M43 family zinc metalloprotease [Bacteroidia bacterium]